MPSRMVESPEKHASRFTLVQSRTQSFLRSFSDFLNVFCTKASINQGAVIGRHVKVIHFE